MLSHCVSLVNQVFLKYNHGHLLTYFLSLFSTSKDHKTQKHFRERLKGNQHRRKHRIHGETRMKMRKLLEPSAPLRMTSYSMHCVFEEGTLLNEQINGHKAKCIWSYSNWGHHRETLMVSYAHLINAPFSQCCVVSGPLRHCEGKGMLSTTKRLLCDCTQYYGSECPCFRIASVMNFCYPQQHTYCVLQFCLCEKLCSW